MIVRRERAGDRVAVRAIHVAAFAQVAGEPVEGEPVEARLVDELRVCDGWVPELSWVAEIDGSIVGHCISTLGSIDRVGEPERTRIGVTAPGLGPIGVDPASQASGVGSALMHASIGAADALGWPCIVLLGDPGYYRRFGFVTSTERGIEPPEPDWGVHFQVRALSAWSDSIFGTFRYASPFDSVS